MDPPASTAAPPAPPAQDAVVDVASKAQFDALVSSHPFVAVQAHAAWCGPCKAISPLFRKHADTLARPGALAFARFDVDAAPDLAQELGVRSLPTFYFFEHGDKAADVTGANPPALKKSCDALAQKAEALALSRPICTSDDF